MIDGTSEGIQWHRAGAHATPCQSLSARITPLRSHWTWKCEALMKKCEAHEACEAVVSCSTFVLPTELLETSASLLVTSALLVVTRRQGPCSPDRLDRLVQLACSSPGTGQCGDVNVEYSGDFEPLGNRRERWPSVRWRPMPGAAPFGSRCPFAPSSFLAPSSNARSY